MDSHTPPTRNPDLNTPPPSAAMPAKPKGVFSLMWRMMALSLGTFALMLAIVLIIPEGNDYAHALVIKHQRLTSLPGRKVVLVGGSNLSFGIDSPLIERETQCSVVNMGLNGYFGARYLMREVMDDLKPGDVVVVAFEWDTFAKDVNGSGQDLYGAVKANPEGLKYLTPRQLGEVTSALPYIAQSKLLRIGNMITLKKDDMFDAPPTLLEKVQSYKNFNPEGDLNGHAGITWTGATEEGLPLGKIGIDPEVIGLIKQFSRDLKARNVSVVVSYTPVMRHYYAANAAARDEVHKRLTSGPDAVIAPRAPKDYVYDEHLFFDTVYHLKTTSRDLRTQQLVGDMRTALKDAATCCN